MSRLKARCDACGQVKMCRWCIVPGSPKSTLVCDDCRGKPLVGKLDREVRK